MNVDNLDINFEYDRDETGRPYFTSCTLRIGEGYLVAWGQAACHDKDRCYKESGWKIAFTRALACIKFSKEDRTKLWKRYHERKWKLGVIRKSEQGAE